MQYKKTLMTVLVMVMMLAPVAWAGHHGKGGTGSGSGPCGGSPGQGFYGPGGGGMGPLGALHGLNLSEQQTEQIAAVLEKHKDAHADVRRQMREARRSLNEAIHSGSFDEARVRKAAQAFNDQLADFSVHRARVFSEIRPILTDDQITQLEDRKKTRSERRQSHQRLNRAIRDYQCPYN